MRAANTAATISVCFPPESSTGVRPLPVFEALAFHAQAVRTFGAVVAVSEAMHQVFNLVERFARTDVSVTLLGETGTGKDVLARSLHEKSLRAAGPFVVFDCGAVAPNLAESELLGHERGSFTGAVAAHLGAFERADGGTLFLDEIGDLPLDLQPRLLRALDGGRIRRVGGTRERPCNVRIVAATNRDLRSDVATGRFREDLFYRLATAVVVIPRLRDRLDDLDLLAHGLLRDLGYPRVKIAESTLTALRTRDWPGNVRELKNTLACALAFVEEGGDRIEPRHLRVATALTSSSDVDRLPLAGLPWASIERAAICQTLALNMGNKTLAARALGVAVSTLHEKLRRHGV